MINICTLKTCTYYNIIAEKKDDKKIIIINVILKGNFNAFQVQYLVTYVYKIKIKSSLKINPPSTIYLRMYVCEL